MVFGSYSLAPRLMESVTHLECLLVGEHTGSRATSEQAAVSVQGRLSKYSKFWTAELEASQYYACDIITSGYRLPFLAFPPAVCAKITNQPLSMYLYF